MLQFDLQFYDELTVAWVRTIKFISGAFFWPTGQLVLVVYSCQVRDSCTFAMHTRYLVLFCAGYKDAKDFLKCFANVSVLI